MQKFSGGYLPINLNFVITDMPEVEMIDAELQGIVSVLHNIIFRGAPTNPSRYLKENLGEIEKYSSLVYYNNTSDLKWENTIKGYYSNKPALDFYNTLKEKLPSSQWSWFLPECPFSDLTRNPKWPKESAVDFYSPLHKVVIEIDGQQHGEDLERSLDLNRNAELVNGGISAVYRLPTDPSPELLVALASKINQSLEESLKTFKAARVSFVHSLTQKETDYLYAIRLQSALLIALGKGVFLAGMPIDLEILNKDGVSEKSLQIALEDFKNYFDNLANMTGYKKGHGIGTLRVVDSFSEDDCLRIDISVGELYDETIDSMDEDCIKVRNDYFFYAGKNITLSKSFKDDYYPQFKNYYSVAYEGVVDYSFLTTESQSMMKSLSFFLDTIFGYQSFRPKQEEIVVQGLKKDYGVIGLLPTGSGKSICFQLTSFLTPGTALVISPLSLLMQDQCDNLYRRQRVSTAYYVNATDSGRLSLKFFENNQSKMTYISPERFFNKDFSNVMSSLSRSITQIVIDEVHCLSEWGHDFRTSYLLLFNFLKSSGIGENCLLMGTSATSSPRVTYDITREFQKIKKNVAVVKGVSTKRPELSFNVINVSTEQLKTEVIKRIAEKNVKRHQKSLFFVAYKRGTTDTKALIQGIEGISVDTCTGDDSGEKKKNLLKNYTSGKTNCIVATKAFGMGLDIPDIRETIHLDFSSSVESAYQEMGRAGRDGQPSVCTMIYMTDAKIEKEIDALFKSSVRIGDIKGLNHFGSLTKQLQLIKNGNDNPEDESAFICQFLAYLKTCVSQGIFSLKESKSKMEEIGDIPGKFFMQIRGADGKYHWSFNCELYDMYVEKALYKLYLLGIVDLWGKSYRASLDDPIYTRIKLNEVDILDINENLFEYIKRYDTNTYPRVTSIPEAVRFLCKWTYDNFFLNRWNSLRTLHDMVSHFESSSAFANRIDMYFSENKELDLAVANPYNSTLWFKALRSNNATVLIDQLARYIESYPNNLAVNVISSIVYLMLGRFDDQNGKPRFVSALETIDETGKVGLANEFAKGIAALLDRDKVLPVLMAILDNKPHWMNLEGITIMLSSLREEDKAVLSEREDYIVVKNRIEKLIKRLEDLV